MLIPQYRQHILSLLTLTIKRASRLKHKDRKMASDLENTRFVSTFCYLNGILVSTSEFVSYLSYSFDISLSGISRSCQHFLSTENWRSNLPFARLRKTLMPWISCSLLDRNCNVDHFLWELLFYQPKDPRKMGSQIVYLLRRHLHDR